MIITFDTQKDSAAAMRAVLEAIIASNGGSAVQNPDPASTEDRPTEKPKQRKAKEALAPANPETPTPPETSAAETPTPSETPGQNDASATPLADELSAKAKAWYIVDGKKDQDRFDAVKSMLAALGATNFQSCADLVKAGEELEKLINGGAATPAPVVKESPYPTDISGLRAYLHPHSKSGDPLQPKVIALLNDFTGKDKSNLGDLKKEDYADFCAAFDKLKEKAAADL